jgi:Transposase DDE domain
MAFDATAGTVPDDLLARVQTLNMRRLRALQVAATQTITYQGGGVFTVTSQSRRDKVHKVELREDGTVECSCEDWKKRRLSRCKHGEAVVESFARFSQDEVAAWRAGHVIPPMEVEPGVLGPSEEHAVTMYDGARRRAKVVIDFPEGPKETTRRNQAYATMRTRVPRLLADLCRRFEKVEPAKEGGQPMRHHDRLFCVLYRTFANRSLPDTVSELEYLAHTRRYIGKAPCKNSLCDYVHDPTLTEDLRRMLTRIARKVRDIETMALVDSTGISSTITQDYLDTNRGRKVVREHNQWFKAHVVCGGVTGIVADVVVTDHSRRGKDDDESEPTADVNYWEPLLRAAATAWTLNFALGDKAYLSEKNIQAADDLGIRAVIPIKRAWRRETKTSKAAQELYDLYVDAIEVFEEIYRYRSKIEGVFSAVKRVCGHYLWARGSRWPYGPPSKEQFERARTAFENELLAKFVILSLRRLVTLEQLHDELIDFSNNDSLQPLPPEWFRSKDMDEMALAEGVEDGESKVVNDVT